MRIIGQNKEFSIDEYGYAIIAEDYSLCAISDNRRWLLGSYRTPERAQEVFEELHAAYEELPFSGNSIYYMPRE